MTDPLYPYCERCGESRGIHKATVEQPDSEQMHPVKSALLECGHTLEETDLRLSSGVVELFQLQHPEYLEIESS